MKGVRSIMKGVRSIMKGIFGILRDINFIEKNLVDSRNVLNHSAYRLRVNKIFVIVIFLFYFAVMFNTF
jgi:hypothetical protein